MGTGSESAAVQEQKHCPARCLSPFFHIIWLTLVERGREPTMSTFENDDYKWRETYFVLFDAAQRPTLSKLAAALRR